MFKMLRAAILLAALPALGGCESLHLDATCTIGDWTITCKDNKASTQDLSASKEAEDEKPVNRPFTQPVQRLEEVAS